MNGKEEKGREKTQKEKKNCFCFLLFSETSKHDDNAHTHAAQEDKNTNEFCMKYEFT